MPNVEWCNAPPQERGSWWLDRAEALPRGCHVITLKTNMNILRRIWAGVVTAVAGIALSILIQVIGQSAFGFHGESLNTIMAWCAGIGFVLGACIGPRTTKPAAKE